MLFYAKVAPSIPPVPKSVSSAIATSTSEESNGVSNGHVEKKMKLEKDVNQAKMNGIANGKRKLDSMQKQDGLIQKGKTPNGHLGNGNYSNGKHMNTSNGIHNGQPKINGSNRKNLSNGHTPEKVDQKPTKKLKAEVATPESENSNTTLMNGHSNSISNGHTKKPHLEKNNGFMNGMAEEKHAPVKAQNSVQTTQQPSNLKPIVFNFGINSDQPPLFAESKKKKKANAEENNSVTNVVDKPSTSNGNNMNANTKQNKPHTSQPITNGKPHEKIDTPTSNGKVTEGTMANSFFSKISNIQTENGIQKVVSMVM